MVFNDDATLMSLFNRYEDEQELKDAVLKYLQNGAVLENIDSTYTADTDLDNVNNVNISEIPYNYLFQMYSPVDSALDMKKRKRLNQQAAAEEKAKK